MGQPRSPKPVKLVMSVITAREDLVEGILADLKGTYGETDFVGPWMVFDFTDYYRPEMGPDLKRRILAFERLIAPETLPSVKHRTNRIEEDYANRGRRRVNIDPGYLSGEHVILATTKAYAHRPYLRDGIYADLTLIYHGKSYRSLDWTYPDYRQPETIRIFNAIRRTYLSQLSGRPEAGTRRGSGGCGTSGPDHLEESTPV
ncbi:MAG: DUF4416 family protein [Deltaproteobacteria bacterium]|nr:DUF4416 family protein [Deltaproteobacteria bacterium]